MSLLILTDIHKCFAAPVLRGVDLAVDAGEIVCLLGPSGCGKTTLLRIVAGLEEADGGVIRFDGADLNGVPVHRRGFGLMFQEFALFPHQNVAENIAFGLRMAGWNPQQRGARVAEMLALVNLEGYAARNIFELSGGERQRIALARSLAPSPRLIMLDEPLGSLDRALREELMLELRAILKQVGVTALYVTHDQTEAFAIADRVGVMQAGRFEQIARPEDLYARPATPFVARFLGLTNLLPARVTGDGERGETPVGVLMLDEAAPPGKYTLLIRPEIGFESIAAPGSAGTVDGTLRAAGFRGSDYHIRVGVRRTTNWTGPEDAENGGDEIRMDFVLPARHRRSHAERLPPVGGAIRIGIDSTQLVLIPTEPAPTT